MSWPFVNFVIGFGPVGPFTVPGLSAGKAFPFVDSACRYSTCPYRCWVINNCAARPRPSGARAGVEIVVYDRAIPLFTTDSEAMRRIHHVCCRLDIATRPRRA